MSASGGGNDVGGVSTDSVPLQRTPCTPSRACLRRLMLVQAQQRQRQRQPLRERSGRLWSDSGQAGPELHALT